MREYKVISATDYVEELKNGLTNRVIEEGEYSVNEKIEKLLDKVIGIFELTAGLYDNEIFSDEVDELFEGVVELLSDDEELIGGESVENVLREIHLEIKESLAA